MEKKRQGKERGNEERRGEVKDRSMLVVPPTKQIIMQMLSSPAVQQLLKSHGKEKVLAVLNEMTASFSLPAIRFMAWLMSK
eukprot:766440-Hanusia_phi.AAC.1